MFQEATVNPDGTTGMDVQKKKDQEREYYYQQSLNKLEVCKEPMKRILEWFEERGINRENLAETMRRQIMSGFNPNTAFNVVRQLEDMQKIIIATERAEEEARRAERDLRSSVQRSVGNGFGVDINIDWR